MTFTPKREQLRGLPLQFAECYGKPHVGAFYAAGDAKSNRLEPGSLCMVCGRPAANSHHCPPLSKGRTFLLATPRGTRVLKPALFALCGSGTTGCHGRFHGGARFKAEWAWDSDDDAAMWWDGTILERVPPHSDLIFGHGRWVVRDLASGRSFEAAAWRGRSGGGDGLANEERRPHGEG